MTQKGFGTSRFAIRDAIFTNKKMNPTKIPKFLSSSSSSSKSEALGTTHSFHVSSPKVTRLLLDEHELIKRKLDHGIVPETHVSRKKMKLLPAYEDSARLEKEAAGIEQESASMEQESPSVGYTLILEMLIMVLVVILLIQSKKLQELSKKLLVWNKNLLLLGIHLFQKFL